MDVFSNKAHFGKRRVSVNALVNLKTTSCQELLYHDFVSAALCSTGDLRESLKHTVILRDTPK